MITISQAEQPLPIRVQEFQGTRRSIIMPEVNSDERVVVQRSTFNIANVILAIAVLLLVLGLLKFMGVSPI
jgi:uncharacterized membrane protein YidH (DUF202 family)